MTKFLGVYRGSAIYEIEEFDTTEGEKMGCKILAKALLSDQQNIQVDFVEEAETEEKAREKIKVAIDRYLKKHNMQSFKIDIR
ncbi:hypothetical protein SAMN05443144_13221 [Fodinibius roseus]|uniref:Uncharacterized protein n=1 Tax=Fodinibius roseus TaxID=1194090 RepID=A0A1M5KI12_9BACT|nr:hypothetical protein [Fodinibius roseus]SHG52476.1 hypothetical protein SAMN05443144_13221 [Fodinibius roseus]